MSSIDDDPQLRELLIRLWGVIDRNAGILLTELPRHLSNDTLLSTAHGYGLIQFIRRNHCHVGGNLVLENGWNVAELHKPARSPVWELVSRGLSEDVDDEIRLRVRLTNQGCDVAARFSRQSAANVIGQVAAVFDTAREAALQCNRLSHHILTKVESAEGATKELRWLFELLADAIESAASAIPPISSSLTAIANENEDARSNGVPTAMKLRNGMQKLCSKRCLVLAQGILGWWGVTKTEVTQLPPNHSSVHGLRYARHS